MEHLVKHIDGHDHDHDHDHDYEHDHGDDSIGQNIILAKSAAMVTLFLAAFILGTVPFKLVKWLKWDINGGTMEKSRAGGIISLLLAFGGGVLLSTTFLHLLPEVKEHLNALEDEHVLPHLPFHLAELLMCIGFFVMYTLEEFVMYCMKKQHNKDVKAFQRGQSVRESVLVTKRKISQSEKIKSSSISIAELMSNENDGNDVYKTESLPPAQYIEKKDATMGSPPMTTNLYDNHHQHQHHHHHHSHHHNGGGGHGHSHIVVNISSEDIVASSIRGLLIVFALSIHELFEGLAIGLQSSASNVWYMFGAVAAHKLVLAFCVGLELVVTKTKPWLAIIYVFTFSVVSPIGIGIGILVTGGDSTGTQLISAVLQGMACGTLLYVVFFEILQKKQSGFLQLLAVMVGFVIMFGLQFIGGHEHSHSHQHKDEHQN